MNLSEIENTVSKLKMEKEQKETILKLIDLKTESDMEKALAKMDIINNSLLSKFDGMNFEIKRLEDKQDAKFGAIDTKFSMVLWAIGILIGLIVTLKVLG